MLVPARRRGAEQLDDPTLDARSAERSMRDVVRSNALFGGRRAVLRAVADVLPLLGTGATLLDVGTGLGDIPLAARRLATRRGVTLTTIGVDRRASLAETTREHVGLTVCADALALPFADRSIDVVTCSQVLHHFVEDDAARLLAELTRVARVAVIVGDLRRSWLAAALFWLVSWPLGFSAITRHDGTLSVLRGFTSDELRALARRAGVAAPAVRRSLGWRLSATWMPAADGDDAPWRPGDGAGSVRREGSPGASTPGPRSRTA